MTDSSPLKDHIPPHNNDAERAVLGALLIDFHIDILTEVQQFLRSDDFYHKNHQDIFSAIVELSGKGEPVDILTLTEALRAKKSLDALGGVSYISELPVNVPTAANIVYYARIVQSCSIRRLIVQISHHMIGAAHDESKEASYILEEAEKQIFNINDKQQRNEYKEARIIVQETVENIEKRYKTKEPYTGVPSGFTALDKLTLGFQNSEMIIVGARPSVGKTALALTMASYIAIQKKVPCGFFTLEMNALSLMHRIVSSEAKIDSNRLKTGLLKSSDFRLLTAAAGRIYEAPLYIDDTPNIRLLDLRAQARRMVSRHKVQIIFVDYIGLIAVEDKNLPRHEQIAEISMSLKALARELEIPVVALSQVGRQSEGKAPGMADLRGSGSLEQDADVVLYLHRDRGIDHDEEEGGIETDLIIAKQRSGPVDVVKLVFIPEFTRFESMVYENAPY